MPFIFAMLLKIVFIILIFCIIESLFQNIYAWSFYVKFKTFHLEAQRYKIVCKCRFEIKIFNFVLMFICLGISFPKLEEKHEELLLYNYFLALKKTVQNQHILLC